MKKKLPLYAVILIALFGAAVAAIVTAQICYQTFFVPQRQESNRRAAELSAKIDALDPEKDLSAAGKFRTIYNEFKKRYTGDLDEKELETQFLKQFFAVTGDRYATYYSADEYAELSASDAGQSVGIGVYVSENARGTVTITHVEEGGPAEKAGLLRGDEIVAVGEQPIGRNAEEGQIPYERATELMRGEAGSTLELTFLRGEEKHYCSIERAVVSFKSVRSEMQSGGIGYIRILSFSSKTPEEFKSAADALQKAGAKALIYDVRSNGGGSLSSIHKVLDYIIPDGGEPGNVVLSTTDALDNTTYYRCGDGHAIDLPSAVLTNGGTASAAELFACALRDYDLAVIVGSTTYGKGVAQSIITLSDGSAYKFTTSVYNPPVSENYDGKGVVPDVSVNMENVNFNLLDFEEDACCQAAVAALAGN